MRQEHACICIRIPDISALYMIRTPQDHLCPRPPVAFTSSSWATKQKRAGLSSMILMKYTAVVLHGATRFPSIHPVAPLLLSLRKVTTFWMRFYNSRQQKGAKQCFQTRFFGQIYSDASVMVQEAKWKYQCLKGPFSFRTWGHFEICSRATLQSKYSLCTCRLRLN